MANAHVTISAVRNRADTDATMPVQASVPLAKQNIASGGSATLSSITGPASGWERLYWAVTAYGGNIWVRFGAGSPAASAGNDHYIPSGTTRFFGLSGPSEKMSVIDA
jgi:hypothetical protein